MGELNNERDILNRFQELKQELNTLASKFNEIESQAQEHESVIKALEPLDNSRKCFRLIGGVLVERTVAEVQPAVKSNCDQLRMIATNLEKQVRNKEKEVVAFQEKYKIRLKACILQGEGDEDTQDESQSKGKAGGAGVLVSSK